ncbi:cytochrome P450 [Xenorhabdus griffiniae]|uniref:cytochrome P450 n=1 Tax=Xenorhabdus griffiniae TaxID=351672 RepID=UPI0037DD28BB
MSKNNIFSTEPLAARAEPVMRGRVLAQMSGDEHRIKRSLIVRQITGNILKEFYEDFLSRICDNIISDLIERDEFDLISEFGMKYSMLSTFEILGVDSKEINFYHERLKLIVKFATGFNLNDNEKNIYLSSSYELEDKILNLIEMKENNPGKDLISFIIDENKKDIKKKITNSEIVALVLNILLAASEPVDKVLSTCIYHLYRNPTYLKEILSGNRKPNDILQESLRITPPVHLIPRLTTQKYITSHGDIFDKGELVYLLIPAANRDPDYFEQPNVFDPNRNFKGHVSYGSGIHTCIGAQFANLQLNLAILKLAPLILSFNEKSYPIFDGVYTRGAIKYVLAKKNK